jgi:ABC-type transport system involved in multi-copper enzyme maturation permease subunit
MMLLRKAWLESRGRFMAAVVVMAILGVSTVLRAPATIAGWEAHHRGETMSYALYIWLSLSHGFLQFLWVVAAVILGLGGLKREQANGSSGFTLALPVSRRAHVLARAGTGAAQAAALAFIPGVIVVALSPLVGRAYPLDQALLFATVLVLGGLVFYCLGFLLSELLPGEYAAPGVGMAIVAAVYVLTKLPGLGFLNVFDAMDGKKVLIGQTFYLGRTLPVATLAASLFVGLGLIAVTMKAVRSRDF